MGLGMLTERIEAVDATTAGVGELIAALRDLNRVEGWVSVTKAPFIRRLAELADAGDAPPVADLLARSVRTSARQAAKNERRAETYGDVPAMSERRAAGHISDEHADALANAAGRLDDVQRTMLFADGDGLAAHAAASTPA